MGNSGIKALSTGCEEPSRKSVQLRRPVHIMLEIVNGRDRTSHSGTLSNNGDNGIRSGLTIRFPPEFIVAIPLGYNFVTDNSIVVAVLADHSLYPPVPRRLWTAESRG